ncbi:beta propeller repeat protein [Streptomyces litchfieldiae]|uniref:Exo-alpha-sialidase n=1 Tax=Streptomyces litchfieldiae TaxID=3075543 RepID=A0ABU2MMZ5_9ACTN|nr:hypothetical protein [Streptomyces sp. DSM 44938]MDT0342494.1 hypothetical protein [Streptomyces sp. DSM 44938]
MRRGSSVATVLLLAAALLSCSSSSEPDEDRDTEPPPPSAEPLPTPSTEPPRVPSATELPGRDVWLQFADERNAFALLTVCETDSGPCAFRLAVLEDGIGWELRDTPLPAADPDGRHHNMEVAGPGSARVSAQHEDGTVESWLTTDGGRTWQPAGAAADGTAEEIPEGAELSLGDGIRVLMPDTAEYRRLAEQPPLADLTWPAATGDGSYWTSGTDPDTGERAIALTEDRGRGWRVLAPLPTPAGHEDAQTREVVAGPGGVLYAFETGVVMTDVFSGSSAELLVAVHRSEDRGESWERVWTGGGGATPRSLLGTPIAAADDTLTVYADDGIYTSHDHGRSFDVTRPGPPPEEPDLTRAGYLLRDLGIPGHYRISADGFTWHTLILGGNA